MLRVPLACVGFVLFIAAAVAHEESAEKLPPPKAVEECVGHVLCIRHGATFHLAADLGQGPPFVSSQRYARVLEGMKLTVSNNGCWELEFAMTSIRGTVDVEFELAIINTQDHSEELLRFRTLPQHICEFTPEQCCETKPAGCDKKHPCPPPRPAHCPGPRWYCQTGFHPALKDPTTFAKIVLFGKLVRTCNSSVVFEVREHDDVE